MNRPATMNSYVMTIALSTVVNTAAISSARPPTTNVARIERRISVFSEMGLGTHCSMTSLTKFPDEAIMQLSAVDMIAEK